MRIFKKLSIISVLFFIFLATKIFAEIVNKVDIQGNERISSETIKIFGDINVGGNYESQDVNLLIKKLYETTFFSNISVEIKNGLLTIVVELLKD